jgi:hypothetical protein
MKITSLMIQNLCEKYDLTYTDQLRESVIAECELLTNPPYLGSQRAGWTI